MRSCASLPRYFRPPQREVEPGLRRNRRLAPGALLAVLTVLLVLPCGAQQEDAPPLQTDPRAEALLRQADEVRFPVAGAELTVAIRTTRSGQETDLRKYRVLSKGSDRSVVMVIEPQTDRGQIMLMSGRELWLFLPAVSQPVRLSLAQRLSGQVANGDIARANFSGDYHARLVGDEEVDGEKLHVLDLTARFRAVTYHRVKLWLRQQDAWPIKAEFYSVSNRLLKTCSYGEYRQAAGRMRPTRLVMTDALKQDEVSVMEYADIRARTLPDRVFSKEYLKKLE
ncbi:MAG: outer membrane lipoprotein-sorting protein [Burkholderiales bacterium]|nr:outer membrane lipoprotein-sorting protein [Burkholderiales bacterium]